MDLTPMHKRVIALDVHQAKITACAVIEHDDGQVEVTKRDFGAFKRDRRALAQWALEIAPEVVVMESTGVYWKSSFAALEAVGLIAWVVNARHVKAVPGRKTDMADAQWLATLARAGLLRASFIAPVQMRQLRLVARQRQKLVGMCSAEKNRLHKVLVDAGIRINVLVADMHGQSARHGQSLDCGPTHARGAGPQGSAASEPSRTVRGLEHRAVQRSAPLRGHERVRQC